jgi:hypothetical protein
MTGRAVRESMNLVCEVLAQGRWTTESLHTPRVDRWPADGAFPVILLLAASLFGDIWRQCSVSTVRQRLMNTAVTFAILPCLVYGCSLFRLLTRAKGEDLIICQMAPKIKCRSGELGSHFIVIRVSKFGLRGVWILDQFRRFIG